jgi:hypothetical protein
MHSVSFVFDGNVLTITFRGTLSDGPVFSYGVLPYQEFVRLPPLRVHLAQPFQSERLCFHGSTLPSARATVVLTDRERISTWLAHRQAAKMKTHPER